MNEKLIIVIGAGGHGSELSSYVKDLAAQGDAVRIAGFVDEKKPRGPFSGSEVLGNLEDLKAFLRRHSEEGFYYITAAGDNRVRMDLVKKVKDLRARNLRPWALIHPKASVGAGVGIGEGTCFAPGSIVTTRARIGRHCILNVKASVSHDCTIGDFVNLNPASTICGNVRIGTGCYIGAGATVIDKVSVDEWTVVGAGAVVIEDLPSHVTAVGIPARVIKSHR